MFFFPLLFYYANVYFIYLDSSTYESRFEINEGTFFSLIIYKYNYTNERLKVLFLLMETSGAARKGDEGWGYTGGSRRDVSRAPGVFFFVIRYYYPPYRGF
jgi:hypothetical protein